MGLLDAGRDDEFVGTVKRLKKALDPDAIIAPGRYDWLRSVASRDSRDRWTGAMHREHHPAAEKKTASRERPFASDVEAWIDA